MKKIFPIFLILILSALLCFSMVACNDSDNEQEDGEKPSACDTVGHSFTVLKKSETKHWYECSVCNAEKPDSKVDHSGGNATCQSLALCSVCSASYGQIGTHDYSQTEWEYKESDGHAHKCKYCEMYDTPVPHTPNITAATEDTAKYCTESGCGYIIEQKLNHTHTEATAWEFNFMYHWHDCIANDGQQYGKAEHRFDDDCDTTCNDGCGYVRTVPHTFTLLKKNETEHWYECSICGAEKTGSRVNHSGGNATCQVKAVCSVCSQSYGNFGGHTHTSSVSVKPTTFEVGKMQYLCACGDNYTEDIPATKSIKILTIGNSFSQNATYHLYQICKDAGIENIVIGNLHKGGLALQNHYSFMSNNTTDYGLELWESSKSDGEIQRKSNVTALSVLEYTDWDYITIQQGSAHSGIESSYTPYLNGVLDYILAHSKQDVKIFWHMTWAYQADSTHASFPKYNNDQMTMYNAILSCVQNQILTNNKISGVIPSGTSIQNLRTSHLGDTLTQDGHHLDKGIGCYTAGLTYLAAITGYDISNIDVIPTAYPEIENHLDCIKDAVKKAIATPLAVTASAYPPTETPTPTPEPEAPDNSFNATLSPLTEDDKSYLTSKGYDPSLYMLLDLKITENAYWHSSSSHFSEVKVPASTEGLYYSYAATQLFTRSELINGSIIRVNEGYQYRPDGWENYPNKSTLTRPNAVATELVVIDEDWWGEYNHRAFNIYTTSGEKIYEADTVNFRIYVPITRRSELSADDKSYLEGLGLNADDYMVLEPSYAMHGFYISTSHSSIISNDSDFGRQFLCTEHFLSRYDLTIGSVIRLTNTTSYAYRPEAWTVLDEQMPSATRPQMVTAQNVTVDEDWWGEWNYRAFNLQTRDASQMTEDGKNVLKIYIKIA